VEVEGYKQHSIFRFHTRTYMAINSIKKRQHSNVRLEFIFSNGIKSRISDSLVQKNGVNLHTGLDILIDVSGDEHQGKGIAEILLSLMAFCLQTPYRQIEKFGEVHFKEKPPSDIKLFVEPEVQHEEIAGNLSIVEVDIFKEVFEQWDKNHAGDNVLSYSLLWFSKGLAEKTMLIKYISIWIALEAISDKLNKIIDSSTQNKSDDWRGLRRICENAIKEYSFSQLKDCRNKIIHEGNFGSDETNEIFAVTKSLIDLYIYAMGKLLNLKETAIIAITNKEVKGLPPLPSNYQIVQRSLEYEDEQLVWDNFPRAKLKTERRDYAEKNGEIQMEVACEITFDNLNNLRLVGNGGIGYYGEK